MVDQDLVLVVVPSYQECVLSADLLISIAWSRLIRVYRIVNAKALDQRRRNRRIYKQDRCSVGTLQECQDFIQRGYSQYNYITENEL